MMRKKGQLIFKLWNSFMKIWKRLLPTYIIWTIEIITWIELITWIRCFQTRLTPFNKNVFTDIFQNKILVRRKGHLLNSIEDGLFVGVLTNWEGAKIALTTKICHIYPTMMEFSTVIIPYLNKTQKTYKSWDTLLEFYWHQYFFTKN